MPIAEIITIGTEILLGEIFDTNSRFLAREFRQNGIDLFRLHTIGDNPDRIAEMIIESLQRADIVITTGGLGPTVDDPTRQAVSQAFNCSLVFQPDLLLAIEKRMLKLGRNLSQNQEKQAYIPEIGEAIPNPVGTAPAFFIERNHKIVISLPGVPSEMEYLWKTAVLPLLNAKFDLSEKIQVRKLKTYGIGEGKIDELIGELERSVNPTVGLSAHFGFVDIRITAKSSSDLDTTSMLDGMEFKVRELLPDVIFGLNEDTIESGIQTLIAQNTQPITVWIDPESASQLRFTDPKGLVKFIINEGFPEFSSELTICIKQNKTDRSISIFALNSLRSINHTRAFAGNPEHYLLWSKNILLGELWLGLKSIVEK